MQINSARYRPSAQDVTNTEVRHIAFPYGDLCNTILYKIPTFLFSFSCLLLMISANLTVVLETHNSNILVKSICDELTRVKGTHFELLIRPTKLVQSV